jgi:cobalt-zinc-cadmium resistance protein CzcA
VLERIIHFSIRQRLFVLFATLGLIGLGIYSFQRLPIDALPDITNVQVQINSEAPGYSPLEVEQRITYLVETSLAGLPNLLETRSLSRYGLSQVTVIFEEGTDIYFARQLINSRLQEVKEKLPVGIQPIMGPIATGLGEIFMWSLEWDKDHPRLKDPFDAAVELRTVQDWIVRPQLRTVPGVAEVNSIGGYVKQYQVAPDPEKLMAFDITFRDVMTALVKNNANVGAGYLEHSGEQYLIRAPGQVVSIEEISNIVIGSHRGVPIHIHDVAEVKIAKELRTGAATKNGRETVLGTVFMLKGENSRTVSLRVAEKMDEINSTLPEGIHANVVYDRTKLVNATLKTVRDNLSEGALFVILVLFLLLGNFRAALITALVIPLSMLFAISGMVTNKISGNLLSLGAIDFGIIIDSAVIIVENCIRRMALEQSRLQRELKPEERHFIVQQAAVEVSRPSIFGVFIIMIVYLPILTLTGIEGKMFQPMAFTVLAALTGALILSLTFIPAMVAQFTSGRVSEKKNPLLELARSIYAPLLNIALNNRAVVVTLAGVLVTLSLLLGTRLGTEFVPTLDEQDMAVHALRIPGTGLDQAASMQHALEKKITEFPEVDYVFAKIGTAEIATDPMPPSVADVFVMTHPRSQWPNPKKPRMELVGEMEQKLLTLPGNKYEFTQPIQMRFNELIAGVRSDVAVKVFGDDLDVLLEEAERVSSVLATVPGATDVRVEQVTGLPVLTIQLDREEMARLGLNVSDVQDVIAIAIGGKQAGQVFQGDRRFDLIVRLPDETRKNIALLKRIPLPYPEGLKGTVRPAAGPATAPGQPLPAFITLGTVAGIVGLFQ